MQDAEAQVLVWRLSGALLAVPLEAVVEVVPVAGGRAMTRVGPLAIRRVPGLVAPDDPRRAVVVRAAAGRLALAADDVEGVRARAAPGHTPTPGWLRTLPTHHLIGLIEVADAGVAALLDVDALTGG